ncbi:MAG: aminotransferase class I/II-fold pyridoxal phosphate-dependent enzyme [Bacteroidetes bacterium]|nr:aminotransferase class I/II-fold pyridoxal phosphate-dependent enzyme [Bacteroidota bacterium]
MRKRIFLSPPHLGGEESKEVEKAIQSNWIAPAGPATALFENKITAYNQTDYCVAVNSGTAAIHLALIVLGVEKGDEVICPTFTFAGSCNPILYQRAVPVFVDAEKESWCLDPHLLEEAITDRIRLGKKPKAIIVVHLFGMPARMDEILNVAKKYAIPVVEDAAEALGSVYNGQHAGTIGDIGVYSFNGNKIITTSGGGALVSFNKEWIDQARYLSGQARSAVPYYHHESTGYNYQLSNISASIGVGQFSVLNERLKQKRKIFETYQSELKKHNFLFQEENLNTFSNRWITSILMPPKSKKSLNEEIRLVLEAENIESRPLWKPMHLQPVFRHYPNYLSGVAERLFGGGLCLPSGTSLAKEDQEIIIQKLIETAGYTV